MAKEAIGKVKADKSIENEGKPDQAEANLKDAGEKFREDAGEKLEDAGEKVKEPGEKVEEAGEKVVDIFKK